MEELARARDRGACERGGERCGQTCDGAGARHRLGEQEYVGRPRARERGHRVHERFVGDPFHDADRGQQRVDERALRVGDARVRDCDGHAAADRGRRIGHGANDRGARKTGGEKLQGPPGHDRHDHGRAAHERRQRRHGFAGDLRLDRDHHRGDVAERVARRIEAQAAFAQRRDLAAGLRLDHGDHLGCEPERQPALQHGASHFARAGEQDGPGQVGERTRFGLRIR